MSKWNHFYLLVLQKEVLIRASMEISDEPLISPHVDPPSKPKSDSS